MAQRWWLRPLMWSWAGLGYGSIAWPVILSNESVVWWWWSRPLILLRASLGYGSIAKPIAPFHENIIILLGTPTLGLESLTTNQKGGGNFYVVRRKPAPNASWIGRSILSSKVLDEGKGTCYRELAFPPLFIGETQVDHHPQPWRRMISGMMQAAVKIAPS